MEKCAFDLEKRKCAALTEKKCEGCKFFKTKEELEAGREKAMNRLMSMDKKQFYYFNNKYYGGRSLDNGGEKS